MHFRFSISQGSVATLITWGGWSSYIHMYRSFQNLPVKTTLKSVDFCRSYRQKSWLFFKAHGVVIVCTLIYVDCIRSAYFIVFWKQLCLRMLTRLFHQSNNYGKSVAVVRCVTSLLCWHYSDQLMRTHQRRRRCPKALVTVRDHSSRHTVLAVIMTVIYTQSS